GHLALPQGDLGGDGGGHRDGGHRGDRAEYLRLRLDETFGLDSPLTLPAIEKNPMAMKWYVVHTYSGHENKAKLSLLDRVRQASMQEKFGDILIPTDTVVELVKGQKRSTTRKFYPGYMFVQMDLDQES